MKFLFTPRKESGFTLIEIILAIGILASIGVISIQLLSNQLSIRSRVISLSTDQHVIDMGMQRIYDDFRSAYITSSGDMGALNLIQRQQVPQFSYLHNNLVLFVRNHISLMADSTESNIAILRYFVRSDPSNPSKRQLMRIIDTDMVDDITKSNIGESSVLFNDIKSFKIQFWDGNKYRDEWDSNANDTQGKIPKLVKVNISIYREDRGVLQQEIPSISKDIKKQSIDLETVIYMLGSGAQSDALSPNWTEYKWE